MIVEINSSIFQVFPEMEVYGIVFNNIDIEGLNIEIIKSFIKPDEEKSGEI